MNISNFMNAVSTAHWSNFTRFMNSSTAGWSGVILATSTTALLGLGLYRWSKPNTIGGNDALDDDFKKIKERISQTYAYVFGGFAITALAAIAGHVNGLSLKILQNRFLTIPIFIGSLAAITATRFIDKENNTAKHVAWAIFNVSMGMMLSPLGFLDQKIVAQAAAVSLGLGAILTLTAYLAPDREFLAWEGPLMTALTTITIASTVALFFPGSAFAYGVDRVSLYGGLMIFSGFLMSSTQLLMEEAEKQSERDFDPINSSQNIYLDGLSIFIRILRIMNENKKEEN